MKSGKRIALRAVLLTLLPAILTYLGKSENILDWMKQNQYFGEGVDLSVFKEACLLLSIVFSFVLLTMNLIRAQYNESVYNKQRTNLLKYNKEIFVKTLASVLEKEYLNINIEIFVPNESLFTKILHRIGKEKKKFFIVRDVLNFGEHNQIGNLQYEVEPKAVGLVGACYQNRSMQYDDDLENTCDTKYGLTAYQLSRTYDVKFSLVCPIFSEKDEVISVVAFNSYSKIELLDYHKKELSHVVLNYTQMLYEYVPELFEPKGGIW